MFVLKITFALPLNRIICANSSKPTHETWELIAKVTSEQSDKPANTDSSLSRTFNARTRKVLK